MVRKIKNANYDKMSLAEFREMYEKKALKERNRLPELTKRRDSLRTELKALEAEIDAIEFGLGTTPKTTNEVKATDKPKAARKASGPRKAGKSVTTAKTGKRTRRRSGRTLRVIVGEVVAKSDHSLSPKEVADHILEKNLIENPPKTIHQQVTAVLTKCPEFERVEKGRYAYKGTLPVDETVSDFAPVSAIQETNQEPAFQDAPQESGNDNQQGV
jgi:hypothetical protein